jgi:hypothetical protein
MPCLPHLDNGSHSQSSAWNKDSSMPEAALNKPTEVGGREAVDVLGSILGISFGCNLQIKTRKVTSAEYQYFLSSIFSCFL